MRNPEKRLRRVNATLREKTPIAGETRKTGLAIPGDLPWGTHFCLFHETKRDLLNTLIPYFEAGLEGGEYCLWVLSDSLTKDEVVGEASARISGFDRYLANGAIELVSPDEWFFQAGGFEIDEVIARFKERWQRASSRGYAGMRVNGSTAWLQVKDSRQFLEFENALDRLIADERMIILCSFPLEERAAGELLMAARTHQFTVAMRRGIWEVIEARQVASPTRSLTPREREILAWVSRGKTAWEIGEILHITRRTVESHIENATRSLGAATRTQAVAIALRERLIDAD
jgi:DNA-binding CsgD family transcriptional regulator